MKRSRFLNIPILVCNLVLVGCSTHQSSNSVFVHALHRTRKIVLCEQVSSLMMEFDNSDIHLEELILKEEVIKKIPKIPSNVLDSLSADEKKELSDEYVCHIIDCMNLTLAEISETIEVKKISEMVRTSIDNEYPFFWATGRFVGVVLLLDDQNNVVMQINPCLDGTVYIQTNVQMRKINNCWIDNFIFEGLFQDDTYDSSQIPITIKQIECKEFCEYMLPIISDKKQELIQGCQSKNIGSRTQNSSRGK